MKWACNIPRFCNAGHLSNSSFGCFPAFPVSPCNLCNDPEGQDSLVTRPPGVDDLRLAGRVLTPDLDVRLLNFCFSTCSWASLLTSQCFCVPVFEGGCVPHWTQARRPEGSDVFPPLLHCSPFFFEAGSL